MFEVRDKGLAGIRTFASWQGVMARASNYRDALVLINDDEELARKVGAHGVHLSSEGLARADRRTSFDWVAASCHTAEELARAATLGLDFALASPVLPTKAHADAQGMGWDRFARLIERSSLPVFALGNATGHARNGQKQRSTRHRADARLGLKKRNSATRQEAARTLNLSFPERAPDTIRTPRHPDRSVCNARNRTDGTCCRCSTPTHLYTAGSAPPSLSTSQITELRCRTEHRRCCRGDAADARYPDW